MGSLNPITTILGAAGSAYSGYRNTTGAYQNAQKAYANNERDIANSAAIESQKNQLESEQEAIERRRKLGASVAKQRAAFGQQGIDTSDGSGESAMVGLFQQNDEDKNYRARLDDLRRRALDQDTASKRQRNLLDLQKSYSAMGDGLLNSIF